LVAAYRAAHTGNIQMPFKTRTITTMLLHCFTSECTLQASSDVKLDCKLQAASQDVAACETGLLLGLAGANDKEAAYQTAA